MKTFCFEVSNKFYEVTGTDYTEAVIRLISILQQVKVILLYKEKSFKCIILSKIYDLKVTNYFDAMKQLFLLLQKGKLIKLVDKRITGNGDSNKIEVIDNRIVAKVIYKPDPSIYLTDEEKDISEREYIKYFGNKEDAQKKLEELIKDDELFKELEVFENPNLDKKIYLINHSWDSYMRTKEYCGFISEEERDQISLGDIIVYFGQGIVFGLFEATDLVYNEFNGWKKKYPYQVKLKPILLSSKGLIVKQLQDKFTLLKEKFRSFPKVSSEETLYQNLVELTEEEHNLIKQGIVDGKKEITVF